MQSPALTLGGWHAPTQDQKPVHIGLYDSTTWDPHRKDGFVPSPIQTYWDGKQWLWQKGGEPCKFQERSWRGQQEVNPEAQMAGKTTIIASQGGTIELVRVVKRQPGQLQFQRIGENQICVLKTRGAQYHKEFKSTDEAIAWIDSKRQGKTS